MFFKVSPCDEKDYPADENCDQAGIQEGIAIVIAIKDRHGQAKQHKGTFNQQQRPKGPEDHLDIDI
jgi:hypothetical protein